MAYISEKVPKLNEAMALWNGPTMNLQKYNTEVLMHIEELVTSGFKAGLS